MDNKNILLRKIESNSVIVGVIGLGYVGLPLALSFAEKNIKVIGFDIDYVKIPILLNGKTYIKHINEARIKKAIDTKMFDATIDYRRLKECDCIIICVPTPLDNHRQPDLNYIKQSGKSISENLKKGQFISLESSTYPGTTEEILLPLLEKSLAWRGDKGKVGTDFFLAFSPEREDPNNEVYNTVTIPKVIGGITEACLEIGCKLYDKIIVKTVPVSSPKVAEASKLLENIYRSVNIALVNELKMVFDRMDVNIWEVIEAAKTKPFGFHAFYPGPGLGGHCIPIDPFYLTWKAYEYDISTKFIELAGEINTMQPYYVVEKTIEALSNHGVLIKEASILILGAAYKKNIDDLRESPALKLIEIFLEKGFKVDYSDPFIPILPKTRKYKFDMISVRLNKKKLKNYDAVLLCTDHDDFDYDMIAENNSLIIDTRNAFGKRGINSINIIRA